jgi:4'-phosphopantetheinyl transferase
MPADALQHRIDVWTWRLGAFDPELAILSAVLSGDEIARASRFVGERDRTQFIVGRARLRQILAGYLAVPPEAMRFSYGKHGKPLLSRYAHAPSFNLSHSGDLAVLAVSGCGAVGIDVEQLRPVGTDVAQRFFTDSENAILARLCGRQRVESFLRCWTRKEALVKANGKGLTGGLARLDVALAHNATSHPLHIVNGGPGARPKWALYDLALDEGFIGALAVHTTTRTPSLRHLKLASLASAANPHRDGDRPTALIMPTGGDVVRAAPPPVTARARW